VAIKDQFNDLQTLLTFLAVYMAMIVGTVILLIRILK